MEIMQYWYDEKNHPGTISKYFESYPTLVGGTQDNKA